MLCSSANSSGSRGSSSIRVFAGNLVGWVSCGLFPKIIVIPTHEKNNCCETKSDQHYVFHQSILGVSNAVSWLANGATSDWLAPSDSPV